MRRSRPAVHPLATGELGGFGEPPETRQMRTAGRSLPDATNSAISDRPSLRSRLRRLRRASWFGARRRRSVPPQKGDAYARYTAHSFSFFFFASSSTRGSPLHALGTRISAAEDCVPAICATHRRRCGLPFQKRQPGLLSFFGSGFGALFLGAIKTKKEPLFRRRTRIYRGGPRVPYLLSSASQLGARQVIFRWSAADVTSRPTQSSAVNGSRDYAPHASQHPYRWSRDIHEAFPWLLGSVAVHRRENGP